VRLRVKAIEDSPNAGEKLIDEGDRSADAWEDITSRDGYGIDLAPQRQTAAR
jgi:hypothetical protein